MYIISDMWAQSSKETNERQMRDKCQAQFLFHVVLSITAYLMSMSLLYGLK